jgi:hypothetical protein
MTEWLSQSNSGNIRREQDLLWNTVSVAVPKPVLLKARYSARDCFERGAVAEFIRSQAISFTARSRILARRKGRVGRHNNARERRGFAGDAESVAHGRLYTYQFLDRWLARCSPMMG